MKLRHVYALSLTIGGSLAPCATADFVNITIHNENEHFANHPNPIVQNAWNALGGKLDVYRIYANFDSDTPQDHVHTVFGSPKLPSFLSSSTGTFFNVIHEDGYGGNIHYDWPVHPSFYDAHPDLAWDTFPTIGFGPLMDQPGMSGDFTVFNHFQTNWVNTETWWTHGSNPAPGDAVPGGPSGFRVGLFQATVPAGADVWGQFALDTGHGIFWGPETAFSTIPAAPGLALFALAALTSRRRRR